MNYRHIYHAGNFADVLKHIVLMQILEYLQIKEKPFMVIDAHAGIGRYDLQSEKHQKTNESKFGILKLLENYNDDMPAPVKKYLDFVKNYGDNNHYPGSPEIIRKHLRDQDKAIFNELHPEDFEQLYHLCGKYKKIKIDNKDAYECVKSSLPHVIKRGLILIDPLFEEKNEFDLMVRGFKQGYKRFPNGIYALWYPIKDKDIVESFYSSLKECEINDILVTEFYINDYEKGKFSGTGLVLVNPTWGLKENLEKTLPFLCDILSDGNGSWLIKNI